ncbi:hypothetical protein NKH18_38635 [Streptomyces sp. M10(2022)]
MGSGTVLNPNSDPIDRDNYVAETPSSSPSKEKPKEEPKEEPKAIEAPKASVPTPAAPTPKPSTTSPAEKKAAPKPTPSPKPKAAPKPNWHTQAFAAPSALQVNQAWTTNRIRMVMQTDGNLVVLNENGNPIWASMTFGKNHRASFQPDGNLVILNSADQPIWSSRSNGHAGARLVLRADAKVTIVHNGRVVWST